MADTPNTPKAKKRQSGDWERMRARVVPKNLRKHVDALEEVSGELEPLLNPPSRQYESYVERIQNEMSPSERRERLEAIIAKADAVIRQVRIQQGASKKEYNVPVLKPILDRLGTIQSIEDELRNRGISTWRVNYATSQRQQCVDSLRHEINAYTDYLDKEITTDTLWNAYRQDFKGSNKEWMTPDEWQQNAFVKHMPETMVALRPIMQARAMLKLARAISNNIDDVDAIARAVEKFTAKLGPHSRITAEIAEPLKRLSASTSTDAERQEVCAVLAASLGAQANKMLARMSTPEEKKRFMKDVDDSFLNDRANFFKQFLCGEEEQIGLFEEPEALAKRSAEIEHMKEKGFTEILDSAPHLRDKISVIRAQAALHSIDTVLYDRWRAVEQLYPCQSAGQGRTGGEHGGPS